VRARSARQTVITGKPSRLRIPAVVSHAPRRQSVGRHRSVQHFLEPDIIA